MSDGLTGSCLCGAIRYRVAGEVRMAGNCHCTKCKKITGGPFQAFVLAREKDFALTEGEEALATYQVSERVAKHFCPRCGTGLFNTNVLLPGKFIVQIGSLDEPAAVSPAYNIHCEHMLPWVKKIGELQSFEKDFEVKGKR